VRLQTEVTASDAVSSSNRNSQQEANMIAIARGSIAEPQKLGPFIDDEMGVVEQLKAERVMKALYRRAAGPGTVIILEGDTMDAIRERMNTLPFVVEGLMSLEYKEITRSKTLAASRRELPAKAARAAAGVALAASWPALVPARASLAPRSCSPFAPDPEPPATGPSRKTPIRPIPERPVARRTPGRL
jgi:hypothetical protein